MHSSVRVKAGMLTFGGKPPHLSEDQQAAARLVALAKETDLSVSTF